MKRGMGILTILIISELFFAACSVAPLMGDDTSIQTSHDIPIVENSTSPPDVSGNNTNRFNDFVDAISTTETISAGDSTVGGFLTESNEIEITDENPYNNPHIHAFWQHYVFELYRRSRKVVFTDTLEYSVSAERGGNELMGFDIVFPQIEDQSQLALAINDYYLNKLCSLRDTEDRFWSITLEDDGWPHPPYYSQTALYAYTWGDIYTVIIELIDEGGFAFHYNNNPLCDNFSISSGSRLTLDDVFSVGFDEYSTRISGLLKTPVTEYTQSLNPWYEEETRRIPMPDIENFMLTPNGLALIYSRYEISDGATGPVILYVNYEDVKDILNTDLGLVE